MAASNSASGSSYDDIIRHSACSACPRASALRLPLGLPRASLGPRALMTRL